MNKGNLFILTIIIASLFSFPLILSTNNRTEMKTDNKSDLLVFPKFKYNRENLNPSTPIEIINDTDLLEQAKNSMWKGTGTKTDPVIIENLLFENFQPNLFNGSRVVEKLSYIKISNVKLNFLIQDNIITASHANVYGIYISDSENGIIRNNLLEYNEIPIFLSDSINFTIKNNVFFPKVVEPFRYFFSNIIDIQGVSNLNLYNNTLFNVGLNIERSLNANVTANSFSGKGLTLSYSKAYIYRNTINNSETAISISRITFYETPKLRQSLYGTVITNNFLINNIIGISFNSNIFWKGFSFECPFYLECDELPENFIGEFLTHYSNVNISFNHFENNSFYAIYLAENNDNNTIYGNNFINNNKNFTVRNVFNDENQLTTQVFEDQNQNASNYWSYNKVGNYWSDYNYNDSNGDNIGDLPLKLVQNNFDNFPSTKPFEITLGDEETGQNGKPDNPFSFPGFFLLGSVTLIFSIGIYSVASYNKFSKSRNIGTQNSSKITFRKYIFNNLMRRNKFKNEGKKIHVEPILDQIEDILSDEDK